MLLKYFFLLATVLPWQLNAQTPPGNNNLPPAQLSPRQQQMLKQMGINSSNPEVMKKQFQQYKQKSVSEALSGGVPPLDSKRIAQVNRKVLTDAEMLQLITQLQSAIEKRLKGLDPEAAGRYYGKIRTGGGTAREIANAASASMIAGDLDPAVWLMGKACQENPQDPNTLNNYATFLIMCGAPQYAIPLLNRLNADYAHNSTVLNNLGQAWYDLGDLSLAQSFLEAALLLSPGNSQANATASRIAAHQGNMDKAIALTKESLKSGFSEQKKKRIDSLGGSMGSKYIFDDIEYTLAGDPMGFEDFLKKRPTYYYYSIPERNTYRGQWANYVAACWERKVLIQKLIEDLGPDKVVLPTKRRQDPDVIWEPTPIMKKYLAKYIYLKEEYEAFSNEAFSRGNEVGNKITEIANNTILSAAGASAEKTCQILHKTYQQLFDVQHDLEKADHEYVKRAAQLLAQLIYYGHLSTDDYKEYQSLKLAYEGQLLEFAAGWIMGTSPFDNNFNCANCMFWDGVPEHCPEPNPEINVQADLLPPFKELGSREGVNIIQVNFFGLLRLDSNLQTTQLDPAYSALHAKYINSWMPGKKANVPGEKTAPLLDADGNLARTDGVSATVGLIGNNLELKEKNPPSYFPATAMEAGKTIGLIGNLPGSLNAGTLQTAFFELNRDGICDLRTTPFTKVGANGVYVWCAGHSPLTQHLLSGLNLGK